MTDPTPQTAGGNPAPSTIAVIGSGYMGGGIAQVFALAGNTVRIADVSAEVAQRNYERILGESRDFEADDLVAAGARVEARSTERIGDRRVTRALLVHPKEVTV